MVMNLLIKFYKTTKQKPARLIFFRDGVSEGQFANLQRFEVPQVIHACRELGRRVNEEYNPPVRSRTSCSKGPADTRAGEGTAVLWGLWGLGLQLLTAPFCNVCRSRSSSCRNATTHACFPKTLMMRTAVETCRLERLVLCSLHAVGGLDSRREPSPPSLEVVLVTLVLLYRWWIAGSCTPPTFRSS